MALKKIKLELRAWAMPNADGIQYEVMRVTNSIEWTPGGMLNKDVVKRVLSQRRDVDIVITAPKGGVK